MDARNNRRSAGGKLESNCGFRKLYPPHRTSGRNQSAAIRPLPRFSQLKTRNRVFGQDKSEPGVSACIEFGKNWLVFTRKSISPKPRFSLELSWKSWLMRSSIVLSHDERVLSKRLRLRQIFGNVGLQERGTRHESFRFQKFSLSLGQRISSRARYVQSIGLVVLSSDCTRY